MNNKNSKKDLNNVLLKYLTLNGDQYSLNLSADEASEIGISNEDFESAIRSLEETNHFIKEAKEIANSEVTLVDPQSQMLGKGLLAMPQGNLETNGQEQATTGFDAPSNASKVRFQCQANAALAPVFTCGTYSSGSWQYKSAVGAGGSATIEVPLYVSGVPVSISFRTTDSNGGRCHWTAAS